MESKANFAIIGAFVLVTLFGIVAFIAYISGKQFDELLNIPRRRAVLPLAARCVLTALKWAK